MSQSSSPDDAGIWLEVTNVRLVRDEVGESLEAQLRGDKADREPIWWKVAEKKGSTTDDLYRTFTEALDRKRTVLARLCPVGGVLQILHYRIQFDAPR